MTLAAVVSFHKYEPSSRGNYLVLFSYFVRSLRIWGSEIDHLYIVDSGKGLPPGLISEATKHVAKVTLIPRDSDSHWNNLNYVIPTIQEDSFMIIDSDMVVYDAKCIREVKEALHNFDIASMTDNSGRPLSEKFSFLMSNENRDKRCRFAPYWFACTKDIFNRIGKFDFTPVQGVPATDSMDSVTEQLLALNPRIYEFPDNRQSLYYREDGNHQESSFLDGPGFKWSERTDNDYGYYHIRNWNGGLYLVETRSLLPSSYSHAVSIMPQQEALRLLAWLYVMCTSPQYQEEIIAVVSDFKVTRAALREYVEKFKSFHPFWNLGA